MDEKVKPSEVIITRFRDAIRLNGDVPDQGRFRRHSGDAHHRVWLHDYFCALLGTGGGAQMKALIAGVFGESSGGCVALPTALPA